jgi:hypothetical protein
MNGKLVIAYYFVAISMMVQFTYGMSFDFNNFQKTLENGCKCGKAFYSGDREVRRLQIIKFCANQMGEKNGFVPEVELSLECPQLAITSYARLNEFANWKKAKFTGARGAAFDKCVFQRLGYTNKDGSVNGQAVLSELTTSYLKDAELASDKDGLLLLQSIIQLANGPTCSRIRDTEEFVRCITKPCFGSASIPL